MKRLSVLLCMVLMLLSGCAGTGLTPSTMGPYGIRTGMDNSTLLGGAGLLIGAVANSDPVGMVVLGVGGYYLGQYLDAEQSARGWTSCQSTLVRQYNRDGTVASVSVNAETCRSGRLVPGYRSGYAQ